LDAATSSAASNTDAPASMVTISSACPGQSTNEKHFTSIVILPHILQRQVRFSNIARRCAEATGRRTFWVDATADQAISIAKANRGAMGLVLGRMLLRSLASQGLA